MEDSTNLDGIYHHKHDEFPWVMLVYQRIVSKKCMPPENWHILKIDAWKTTSPFKNGPSKKGTASWIFGKNPSKRREPNLHPFFDSNSQVARAWISKHGDLCVQPNQPPTNPQTNPNPVRCFLNLRFDKMLVGTQDCVSRRRPVEWSHPLLWARHHDVGLKCWPEIGWVGCLDG